MLYLNQNPQTFWDLFEGQLYGSVDNFFALIGWGLQPVFTKKKG